MASVVLIDPTIDAVAAELQKLADAADYRQRSRTLDLNAGRALGTGSNTYPSRLFQSYGVIQWGGEGVVNSYPGRAETSVAGVVWFADADGQSHVRIEAARIAAPKSSFGRKNARVFPGLDGGSPLCDFVAAVYPDVRLPEPLLKKHTEGRKADRWPALKVAIVKDAMDNPFDPAPWAALADWYSEQESGLYARNARHAEECRKALAVLCTAILGRV